MISAFRILPVLLLTLTFGQGNGQIPSYQKDEIRNEIKGTPRAEAKIIAQSASKESLRELNLSEEKTENEEQEAGEKKIKQISNRTIITNTFCTLLKVRAEGTPKRNRTAPFKSYLVYSSLRL